MNAKTAGVLCVVELALAAGVAWGKTERMLLDTGWRCRPDVSWEPGGRKFTFDNMAAWLDDCGRELMKNEPLPSIRPARAPDSKFAEFGLADASWRTVRVPHDRVLDAVGLPAAEAVVEGVATGN